MKISGLPVKLPVVMRICGSDDSTGAGGGAGGVGRRDWTRLDERSDSRPRTAARGGRLQHRRRRRRRQNVVVLREHRITATVGAGRVQRQRRQ